MKILQINSHYDQGGAARIVACIHRQLLQNGQQSFVAYGRGMGQEEENVFRFNRTAEVYFSAFMSRVTGINGWWNHKATGRLISFIEQIQPDIIHLHALHGYYLQFARFFDYINARGIPCVWTFHDCHAFVGNCGYYFDCDKWKTGCGNCSHIHNYPNSQFFDFTSFMWKKKKELFTECDKKIIVTPSEWLAKEVKQSFFGKYPCVIIHNGIDVHRLFYPRNREKCREKYGFSKKEKLVLGIAVGYRDPRKGVKYIIQMARDLKQEIKVILIGWNKEEDRLLAGIDNIIPLPSTESTDMLAEYYSMADVFVLPSLAENYATVALEAMACGTPVVGFAAGGIPEQLAGNKGIVVEMGNQEEFTEAVRRAVSQESSLLRGEALAEIMRRDNSMEKMVEAYIKIYRELLG